LVRDVQNKRITLVYWPQCETEESWKEKCDKVKEDAKKRKVALVKALRDREFEEFLKAPEILVEEAISIDIKQKLGYPLEGEEEKSLEKWDFRNFYCQSVGDVITRSAYDDDKKYRPKYWNYERAFLQPLTKDVLQRCDKPQLAEIVGKVDLGGGRRYVTTFADMELHAIKDKKMLEILNLYGYRSETIITALHDDTHVLTKDYCEMAGIGDELKVKNPIRHLQSLLKKTYGISLVGEKRVRTKRDGVVLSLAYRIEAEDSFQLLRKRKKRIHLQIGDDPPRLGHVVLKVKIPASITIRFFNSFLLAMSPAHLPQIENYKLEGGEREGDLRIVKKILRKDFHKLCKLYCPRGILMYCDNDLILYYKYEQFWEITRDNQYWYAKQMKRGQLTIPIGTKDRKLYVLKEDDEDENKFIMPPTPPIPSF